MKKIFFAFVFAFVLSACGPTYNTALKQVELGMTKQQIVALMGQEYITTNPGTSQNTRHEIIEYKDKFKYHWMFEFSDGRLVKWWKEKE